MVEFVPEMLERFMERAAARELHIEGLVQGVSSLQVDTQLLRSCLAFKFHVFLYPHPGRAGEDAQADSPGPQARRIFFLLLPLGAKIAICGEPNG